MGGTVEIAQINHKRVVFGYCRGHVAVIPVSVCVGVPVDEALNVLQRGNQERLAFVVPHAASVIKGREGVVVVAAARDRRVNVFNHVRLDARVLRTLRRVRAVGRPAGVRRVLVLDAAQKGPLRVGKEFGEGGVRDFGRVDGNAGRRQHGAEHCESQTGKGLVS